MVFAVAADACTELSCPIMNAGPKIQYKWADGVMKQPTQVSAPKYVDLLMAWVQSQLDDQALFPTKPGDPFPDDFMPRARNVYRRLFRVYAHVFHQHYETIVSNAFEPCAVRNQTLTARSIAADHDSQLTPHALYKLHQTDH